jgi:uncharacterized membrane protein YhiD involved in acid resistance
MMSLASPSLFEARDALLALLVAFLLVHVLAYSYVWSHRAMAYSTSFVRSLVLGAIAVTVMIMAIGNNIAWGVGVMGAMAMVQFRTNFRDPRDIMFMFAALVIGVCAGTHAFVLGIVGTLIFCIVAIYLNFVPFGQTTQYDAMLRFTLDNAVRESAQAAHAELERFCSRFVLSMLQPVSQGESSEHVYQVRFRRNSDREDLILRLGAIPGLSALALMLEDSRVDM